jgi:hypothetical protein
MSECHYFAASFKYNDNEKNNILQTAQHKNRTREGCRIPEAYNRHTAIQAVNAAPVPPPYIKAGISDVPPISSTADGSSTSPKYSPQ